jgi:hypothetical protein
VAKVAHLCFWGRKKLTTKDTKEHGGERFAGAYGVRKEFFGAMF